MSRLLVALHPDAGVDAARFVAAWNADEWTVGARIAEAKPADPGQSIPGMELVVVQLQDNQTTRGIHKVLKRVLKELRQDSAKPTATLLPTTPIGGHGDLFAVIPAAPRARPDRPRRAVFTTALTSVCRLSRACSPARWRDWDQQEASIQFYVLFWLVGLSAILFFGPTTGGWRFVMLGIVLYRLQELMFATLDNAFGLTDRARQETPAYDWPTPLLLSLVSIIQVVLIFAIAYLVLIGPNKAAFASPPSNPLDAFFLSWISLPPLGGGAIPLSAMARVLTISEEATGLLLVVIAIGRFLAGTS
jgi:hypothetical protein